MAEDCPTPSGPFLTRAVPEIWANGPDGFTGAFLGSGQSKKLAPRTWVFRQESSTGHKIKKETGESGFFADMNAADGSTDLKALVSEQPQKKSRLDTLGRSSMQPSTPLRAATQNVRGDSESQGIGPSDATSCSITKSLLSTILRVSGSAIPPFHANRAASFRV